MKLLKREKTSTLPVRALQFGEGNFLRAFIDWMIHEMNQQGKFNGLVQIIQPLPAGMTDAINAQDGLYTLILRGIADGKVVEKREIIAVCKPRIDIMEDTKFSTLAAEKIGLPCLRNFTKFITERTIV